MPDVAKTPPSSAPWASRLDWLAQPGVVAALWVLTTFVHVADQLRFPDLEGGWQYVSSVLFMASVPVLAAFIAAAFARARSAALPLAGTLMLTWFAFSLAWLCVELAAGPALAKVEWISWLLGVLVLVVTALAAVRITRSSGPSLKRAWAAAAVAVSILIIWPALSLFDEELARISAQYAAPSPDEVGEAIPEIDEERLWTAQPSLVEAALAQLAPRVQGEPATFLITVGAGGSQQLFGREARKAREVLGESFGARRRSLVLANDEPSLERVPLATNTNLETVLTEVGKRAHARRDLVVIYLTAHGNRNAELSTNLPDYADLNAIGAKGLASALARAGIRRRVIILSACYAGSWIKPLASDDTIVVAAARADRTSFGCSDDRELTFFGEALLKGPLASGASLADGFRAAKRTVTRWEADGADPHSEPQAFVGKNMSEVWAAKRPS